LEYNLTNFPVKGTPQAYERWGKGFKKELRDMKEHGIPTKIVSEILGEN